MKKGIVFFQILWALLAALLFSFAHPGFGQDYLVHHYTESDGLPSSVVYDMTQDKWGRLWFATRAGIAVYDGVNWKYNSVSEGFPVSSFSWIETDNRGWIWTLSTPGQDNLHVMFFDGEKWDEIPYPPPEANRESKITSFQLLEPMKQGEKNEPSIAIATQHMGLLIWNGKKWRQVTIKNGLLSNTVNGVTTLEGKFYAATDRGLSVIEKDKLDADNRLNDRLNISPQFSREIKAITIERKDRYADSPLKHSRIWLYGGQWLGYLEENRFYRIHNYRPQGDTTGRVGAPFILPDYRGGIFISFYYKNHYFNYQTGALESIGMKSGLISEGAYSMFIDFEKNIWIACHRGVSKIVSRRFGSFQMRHGLLQDEVTAVLEYEKGEFVFGHNNGITFFDGKTFEARSLPIRSGTEDLLLRVLDLGVDSKKNIWVARSNARLIRTGKQGHIKLYGPEEGLPLYANCLWIDPDDTLWVGTGRGLYIMKGDRFFPVEMGGFDVHFIRKIYKSSKNIIYLATHNSGIYVYKNGTWENYKHPENPNANSLYAVRQDSGGKIFLGTLAGLFVLKNNEIKKFAANDFEIHRPVYLIFEDNHRRLWFGMDNGVVCWDGRKAVKYSTPEGLIGQETNRAAGIVDSLGRLWIGTNRGVSVYDRAFDNIGTFIPPPRVQLLALEVSDRNIPLKNPAKPIDLAYKENNLVFHFRGISFLDETRLRFKYKLEGYDTQWWEERSHYKQMVKYPNLPPGIYRLHLKVENALGIWSDTLISPEVIISNPFYKRWWFYLVVLLSAGVLITGIQRYFSEKRYSALLEKQVAERTRQLEISRQQLERARKMEAIGRLAGGVAHDLNNILTGITTYPEILLMQIPGNSPLQKPLLTIKQTGEKAAAMVRDLLTLSPQGIANGEVVNLNDILEDYLNGPEYERLKSIHPAVRFEIELADGLFNLTGSPIHLFKTVMNLVANAAESIPRGKGGLVRIKTGNRRVDKPVKGYDTIPEGEYVVLNVSDSGSGISPGNLDRIFEPFYTRKEMGRRGTGLGMSVVWATVKDHKGYIDIKSEKGKGTVFELYFPFTRKKTGKKEAPLSIERYKGSEKILVVDDVKQQREVASLILTRLGYQVTLVSSGEEAVEYMKNNSAHLVVIDMIMEKGIDGLETYRRIIRSHPGQKAIIVSGFSETEDIKEMQRLGVGTFVKKPYTIAQLGRAVREELDSL